MARGHSRTSSAHWKGKEDARLLLTRLNARDGQLSRPADQRMALWTIVRYSGLLKMVGPCPSWMATTRDVAHGPIHASRRSLLGLSVINSDRTRGASHMFL